MSYSKQASQPLLPFLLKQKSDQFDLLVTVRRLKFQQPLTQPAQKPLSYFLRFAGDKRVQVPALDATNSQLVVNFGASQGTCGVTLTLSELVNKVPIELVATNTASLLPTASEELTVVCENQCSLRKLHQVGGIVKTEVRLYCSGNATQDHSQSNPSNHAQAKEHDEKNRICSVYIELEKRGGRNPSQTSKKQLNNVIETALEYDFPAFESLANKVRQKGFSRLPPDERQRIQDSEPVIVKPIEWKDHVGLRDNLEIVKILETVYGLLCNLEIIITFGTFFMNLVMIKNTSNTVIFLLFSTFVILWFETVLPICLIAAAFKMVTILYYHQRYQPNVPDVKANLTFIRIASEIIASAKYNIDLFIVEVIYWGDQKRASKMVAWLLILAGGVFLFLHIVGIRLTLCLGLYALVGYQSQMCYDISRVIYQVVGEWNLSPLEKYILTQFEKVYLFLIQSYKNCVYIYELLTCYQIRKRYQQKKIKKQSSTTEIMQDSQFVTQQSQELIEDKIDQPPATHTVIVEQPQTQQHQSLEYDDQDSFDFCDDEEFTKSTTTTHQEGLTMEMTTYENERWWIGQGWSEKMLPQERSNWSDLGGHMHLPKSAMRLPGKNWRWVSEWRISRCTQKYLKDRPNQTVDHDGTYDNEGWQYAIEWGMNFSGTKGMSEFVRRRRWTRTCVSTDAEGSGMDSNQQFQSLAAQGQSDSDQKSARKGSGSHSSSNHSPHSQNSNKKPSNQLQEVPIAPANGFKSQPLPENPFNQPYKLQTPKGGTGEKNVYTINNALDKISDAKDTAKVVKDVTKHAISSFFKDNKNK